MNSLFKKTMAFVSAGVLSFCGCLSGFEGIAADTEEKTIKVIFDFNTDLDCIEFMKGSNGKYATFEDFASYEKKPGEIAQVPNGSFIDAYTRTNKFGGWTIDNFYGYFGGDIYIIPEDYEEDTLVFKALWYNTGDEKTYYTYDLDLNGQTIETPEWLNEHSVYPGMVFSPDYTRIPSGPTPTGEYMSYGLECEGRILNFGDQIVAADHDVVLKPIWYRKMTLTYTAGDVDRIVGNDTVSFTKTEASRDELAAADRFSREGFNIIGWESDYDNKIYKPGETMTMPADDVVMTAVWAPKNYVVVFITGNSGPVHKVPGTTDTSITCPEPEHTVAGKYFVGWKDSNGDIYQPGDEYLIKGVAPGLGISFTGVWAAGEKPDVTPTETTTTAPVTTEATAPAETTTEAAPVQTTTAAETATAPVTTETVPSEDVLFGDANCDGKVTIADATAILQAIGNPDNYALSEQGKANADCYAPGSGITGQDALAIQKLDAHIIEALPEVIPE